MRIGVVGFINTLPLAHGLEEFLPQAEILRATPARIGDELAKGKLDVGLVPVAALPANPGWSVVPGLGIAAEGPVRSVLLVSRVPRREIRRLATDPASRTSNLLAQVLLARDGIVPEIIPGPADVDSRLQVGDATVIIGDEALNHGAGEHEVLDLGGAWTDWTGLPFVFAVWAGPGAGAPGLSESLTACYRKNRLRVEELAKTVSRFPRDEVIQYLTHSIHYTLGERETQGLGRYLSLGAEAGFFPGDRGAIHVHAG